MNRFQLVVPAAIIGLAIAAEARAETPGLQWGFDFRPINTAECVRRAQEIIAVMGFQVTTDGELVAGSGPNVAVLVDCPSVPQGVHILVVGASPDSTLAERTRNEVRIAVMRSP